MLQKYEGQIYLIFFFYSKRNSWEGIKEEAVLFCLFLRHAAVEQRGSALFHSILLLITRRAHQTRHNYSHSLLTYSNAASHLRDNYEQFFSHVESFVNKGDSALKENLLCDGGKEKEKKRVK